MIFSRPWWLSVVLVSLLTPSVFAEDERSYVVDEIFVCFEENATQSEIERIIEEYELKEKRRFLLTKAILYKLPKETDAAVLKPKLHTLPSVHYADLNNKGYALVGYTSNEPYAALQWSLYNSGQEVNGISGTFDADIDWEEAMTLYDPQDDVVVAVIDSGVALDHPEVGPRLGGMTAEMNGIPNYDDDGQGYVDDLTGWDFIGWDNDPSDLMGHGTNVAGIIAGTPDNVLGITGVAPNAYILPLRVFNEYGGGATDERIILAMAYAIDGGARVINLSLGKGQPFSIPIQDAVYQLETDYDTLLICAAGNGGDDGFGDNVDQSPFYPACYDGRAILSVAASNQKNELAPFSNYGATGIDLAAPGTNILAPDVSRGIIYSENFEVSSGQWSFDSGPGNLSPFYWSYFTDIFGNTWVTDSDYDTNFNILNYAAYTNSYLKSPVYDLSGVSAPRLEVTVYHDLAYSYYYGSYDYLFFEVSNNGGVTWDFVGYTYGESHSYGSIYSFDLSDYEGEYIQVRFRLWSDGSLEGDGVYVDNLEITGVTSFSYTGEEYEFVNGTSFSAPIVSGIAALILAQRPDLTALDARDIIMQSVTKVDELNGKVASGGVVNAAEALRLANSWKKTHVITVTATTGGSVTGGGSYEEGSVATITATPSAGYTFSHWSDGVSGSANPLTGSVTTSMTITANFAADAAEVEVTQSYGITVTTGGGGTVAGGGTYQENATATITASPSAGYTFSHWSGGASGSANPLTVIVATDLTISAIFSPIPSEVTTWDLATEHENNWRSFNWFGYFHDTGSGWIYHYDLGWLYRVSDTTASIWLWDNSLGWLWTNSSTYPFLYSNTRDGWLSYAIGSPRYFWAYNVSKWTKL